MASQLTNRTAHGHCSGSFDVQPQAWFGMLRVGRVGCYRRVLTWRNSGRDRLGGQPREIIHANGAAVWRGHVTLVEVTVAGRGRGISLDRMANRVQVRYAQPQPGGRGGVGRYDLGGEHAIAGQLWRVGVAHITGVWRCQLPKRQTTALRR